MAERQRKWARKVRNWLLDCLGRECADCGTHKNLEFDCIKPKGDRHHKIEWSWRMSFYRKEFFNNNLAIRCQKCNARKGERYH